MSSPNDALDLSRGVALADIPDEGLLAGAVGDQPVMLARFVDDAGRVQITALDATCTHAGAPLPNGIRTGDLVRCPFHHACFDLRSGEALLPPAYEPLRRWHVRIADGVAHVSAAAPDGAPAGATGPVPGEPERVDNTRGVRRVVVVGGGAAGFAAVERLRRAGYDGQLSLLSGEPQLPVDRTKLSKAYLSGQAGAASLPLLEESWYADHGIEVRLSARVTALDLPGHSVSLADGSVVPFDALVLATGAEATRLRLPGFDRPEVFTLRTVADADAIIAAAGVARHIAIVGSGFIGMEVAAAMRERDLAVTVVSPAEVPLAGPLGEDLGRLVLSLHIGHGVHFVTGEPAGWTGDELRLTDGRSVAADAVLVGMGVSPRTELAERAGLRTDDGIVVDMTGETEHAGVFAAGDVARFPDPLTGRMIRVEHWAQAQRAGSTAAVNLLGGQQPLLEPPYFWSKHYSSNIRYSGHAVDTSRVEIDGSLTERSAVVRYLEDGRVTALAGIGRDQQILRLEQELLRGPAS